LPISFRQSAIVLPLSRLSSVRLYGIADPRRLDERTPTFSFTHERLSPDDVARYLARQGIFVWSGNFYAVAVVEALGLPSSGLVRAGLLHYNTADDVDRLERALREID